MRVIRKTFSSPKTTLSLLCSCFAIAPRFCSFSIVDTRCKKIGSQRLVWFFIALKMLGSSGLIMVEDLDLG
ncbi:hypothetical protein P8452_34492 [Trifolium repens]|nr:hypothetical protein P8452_34492 [Trifolium repens]